MKAIIAAFALLFAVSAHAGCDANDRWTGQDKAKHFAVGGAIAMGVTAYTGNETHGFVAGSAIGILKEVSDSRGRGHCSLQDAVVTALGAYVGSKAGRFVFERRNGTTFVGYNFSLR
jgi:uncharacterized protein YfiM (DUF2279 family)